MKTLLVIMLAGMGTLAFVGVAGDANVYEKGGIYYIQNTNTEYRLSVKFSFYWIPTYINNKPTREIQHGSMILKPGQSRSAGASAGRWQTTEPVIDEEVLQDHFND